MKLVGSFFDKFNNSAIKEIQKRTYIAEIIKREANVDVSIENIVFISNNIKLRINSIEKNQIFIKKQRILDLISKRIPNLIIKDIN